MICKHALFVAKMSKHALFVAEVCKRVLNERFCWIFCGARKAANFCHPALERRGMTCDETQRELIERGIYLLVQKESTVKAKQ